MMHESAALQAVLEKAQFSDLTDKDRELAHREYASRRRRILDLDVEAAAFRLVEPLLEGPHRDMVDRAKPQTPTAQELGAMPVPAIPVLDPNALTAPLPPDGWQLLLPWQSGSSSQVTNTTPATPYRAEWSTTRPQYGEISLAVGGGCFRGCPSNPPSYTDDCYAFANDYPWLFGRGSTVSGTLKVFGQFPFGPLARRTRLDVTTTVTAWGQNQWPYLLEPHARYDMCVAMGNATLTVGGHMPAGQEPRPSHFRFLEAAKRGDGAHNETATPQFVVGNSCVLEAGADYVLVQITIDLSALYTWPTTNANGDPGLALVDMSSGEHALMMMYIGHGPVRVGTPHIVMSPA